MADLNGSLLTMPLWWCIIVPMPMPYAAGGWLFVVGSGGWSVVIVVTTG